MMQLSHEYPMKISIQFFSSQKSSTGHAGSKWQYSQCNKKRRSSQKLLSKLAKIVEDVLCKYKLYSTDTVQWPNFLVPKMQLDKLTCMSAFHKARKEN